MDRSRCSAQVEPMSRGPRSENLESSLGRSRVEEYAMRAIRILQRTKQPAHEVYERARMGAAEGYTRAVHRVQDLAAFTRTRAQRAKQEHPVQLLAFVAGAAFVAGIAIRIWRSRTS